jgi:nicotinamide-nucleotide amidase
MESLLPVAERIARALKDRRETLAVAESSAGGLIAASLLAVPGASAYFLAGAVVYTRPARRVLMGLADADVKGVRSASPPYAMLLARTSRQRVGATWGLAETGASGPSGNSYGDAPGHSCLAVSDGVVERVITLETGSDDRVANMRAFAKAALELLEQVLASERTAG